MGHTLDYEEEEYAIYYYESGFTGLPDFGSERMMDFCLMLYGGKDHDKRRELCPLRGD